MNCNDLKPHLMPYADGELEPALAAEVEAALNDCPECQAELAEIQRVTMLAREAALAPAAAVDFSGVYDQVMARVRAEAEGDASADVPAAAATPGPLARFGAWLGEVLRFERPLVLAGAAALALLLIFGLSRGGDEAAAPTPNVANIDKDHSPVLKRRGAEGEVKSLDKNTAFVESISADKGTAYVEFDQDDPEAPMVLWHVVDEEGAPAPKGL